MVKALSGSFSSIRTYKSPSFFEWNLTSARSALEPISRKSWKVSIENMLNNMGYKIENQSYNCILNGLTKLDYELEKIWSADTLMKLIEPTQALTEQQVKWLSQASHRLVRIVEALNSLLQKNPDQLSEPLKAWIIQLPSSQLSPDIQKAYKKISFEKLSNGDSGATTLAQRSQIDPELTALHQRLSSNQLKHKDVLCTTYHSIESQKYFKNLLAVSGLKTSTLSGIRNIESSRFESFNFSIEEALDHIQLAFQTIHPTCAEILQSLLKEGRLRILQSSEDSDLCLDTPFGSFVQVQYNGEMTALIRFVHELGHAIHQELHRTSTWNHLTSTDLESETWAMAFENAFLTWLVSKYPQKLHSIKAFKDYQRIEMSHRHRMLHQFEECLHSPLIVDENDIDKLWLSFNKQFYGDFIEFDKEFRHSWKDIHHFFISPFYLSLYCVANERANLMDLTRSIQMYRVKTY